MTYKIPTVDASEGTVFNIINHSMNNHLTIRRKRTGIIAILARLLRIESFGWHFIVLGPGEEVRVNENEL